jgi:hypothetical protein
MKQIKKAKICFIIHIAGFFFKKNSVMKCLRSKKGLTGPVTTTNACAPSKTVTPLAAHCAHL